MKAYKTLGVIRLYSGKIGLSDNQARKRMNYLSKTKAEVGGGNIYEIEQQIQFKAGEVIGLETVPKPYARFLEDLDPDPEPEPESELESEPEKEKPDPEPEKTESTKKKRSPKK